MSQKSKSGFSNDLIKLTVNDHFSSNPFCKEFIDFVSIKWWWILPNQGNPVSEEFFCDMDSNVVNIENV